LVEFVPVIASFITAWAISFVAIPTIINVSSVKHLFDVPDSRKSHDQVISRLGGVAIVASWLIAISFWIDAKKLLEFQYIICSVLILFLTGIKDDLVEMSAKKKFALQIIAASILVFSGDCVVRNFGGAFGIEMMPLWIAYPLSLLAIIGVTNAFNLIDGINTLCSGIGMVSSLIFGTWFLFHDDISYALVAFSLAGSLSGFIPYNKSPARIFMGDTGSMLIGMMSSVLAIKFVNLSVKQNIKNAPLVAIGILIIPLFDTFRVFTLRLLNKRSPFKADRNHLHHLLLELGHTHMRSSAILISVNLLWIAVCFSLYQFGHLLAFAFVMAITLMAVVCHGIAKRFDPVRLWGGKLENINHSSTEEDDLYDDVPLPFPQKDHDDKEHPFKDDSYREAI